MTPTQIPSFRYQFTPSFQFFPHWRRGRDSNPRWPLSHNGFQDRRDRPLCHPSGLRVWQGGRDSNPQPTVLETATLPIELPPYSQRSLYNVAHAAGPDGPATFTNCESLAF